jgi:hypothetical protein
VVAWHAALPSRASKGDPLQLEVLLQDHSRVHGATGWCSTRREGSAQVACTLCALLHDAQMAQLFIAKLEAQRAAIEAQVASS